jgi:hypothetical protein
MLGNFRGATVHPRQGYQVQKPQPECLWSMKDATHHAPTACSLGKPSMERVGNAQASGWASVNTVDVSARNFYVRPQFAAFTEARPSTNW